MPIQDESLKSRALIFFPPKSGRVARACAKAGRDSQIYANFCFLSHGRRQSGRFVDNCARARGSALSRGLLILKSAAASSYGRMRRHYFFPARVNADILLNPLG